LTNVDSPAMVSITELTRLHKAAGVNYMDARLTLNVDEAAKLLGLNRITVYRLVGQGAIPNVRIGRRIIIPRRGLEEWLERESQKAIEG
jgi:excisionase family DNA binding protein